MQTFDISYVMFMFQNTILYILSHLKLFCWIYLMLASMLCQTIFCSISNFFKDKKHVGRENRSYMIIVFDYYVFCAYSLLDHPTLNCLQKPGGVNKFNALLKFDFLFTQLIEISMYYIQKEFIIKVRCPELCFITC